MAAKLRIMYDDLGIKKNEKLGIERKLTDEERKQLEERAKEYFTLAAKYDDAPLGPWGAGTVGPPARAELLGLKNAPLLRIGQVAPDIAGEALDGDEVQAFRATREEWQCWYSGPVGALRAWQWCRTMKNLVERVKGKPFVLIGVNGDGDKDKARRPRRNTR